MKKFLQSLEILAILMLAIVFSACGSSSDNLNRAFDTENGEFCIKWHGKSYYAFTDDEYVSGLQNTLIGYMDNDKSKAIYSVAEYSTDEWLILKIENLPAELYKEKLVEIVPEEFEEYAPQPDTLYEPFAKIIEDEYDDIVLIKNSYQPWNFTFNKNTKLEGLDTDVATLSKAYLGIDAEAYNGKTLDVFICDALSIGSILDKSYLSRSYVAVFSGKDLAHFKEISFEEFEIISGICRQLSE